VPHISLVFREMWDTAGVPSSLLKATRKLPSGTFKSLLVPPSPKFSAARKARGAAGKPIDRCRNESSPVGTEQPVARHASAGWGKDTGRVPKGTAQYPFSWQCALPPTIAFYWQRELSRRLFHPLPSQTHATARSRAILRFSGMQQLSISVEPSLRECGQRRLGRPSTHIFHRHHLERTPTPRLASQSILCDIEPDTSRAGKQEQHPL
jgi:hypothetical protein